MIVKRTPVRLIVCVDGTWFNPDGVEHSKTGSLSNVFRSYTSVQEGRIETQNVVQKKKYWPGPGTESNKVVKTAAGIWGLGCEEIIKDVYEYCCKEANQKTDEIFFFGFSRGAYIVRAVAGLLHNMRAIKTENNNFDADYKQGLEYYPKLCEEMVTTDRGQRQHFLSSKTRESPTVRFMGCFDTVMALKVSPRIHDISVNTSTCCYRQALALNEERLTFKHEMLRRKQSLAVLGLTEANYSKPQYTDAWFIGTHADIGGGNKHDGLSLYPLQWILSEAIDQGLCLNYHDNLQEKCLAENFSELLFPSGGNYVTDYSGNDPETKFIPNKKEPIRTGTGTRINMWDIRSKHQIELYKLQINVSTFALGSMTFSTAPRRVFDNHSLAGYQRNSTSGTIIHPSAYMLIDTCSFFNDCQRAWSFGDDLKEFRKFIMPDKSQQFWEAEMDNLPTGIDNLRILICGNNGVGKSTLINRVFGIKNESDHVTDVHEEEHGIHDITKEIRHRTKPHLILHDSRGFQARGEIRKEDEVNIVQSFLQDRLGRPAMNERLHAIWYCVEMGRNRLVEEADKELFNIIKLTASAIPLVLVLTKKDKYQATVRSEQESKLKEAAEESARGLENDDDNDNNDESDDDEAARVIRKRARELAADLVNGKAKRFREAFEKLGSYKFFCGPVLTSTDKKDAGGYRELVNVTKAQLQGVIHDIFVASQQCTVDPKIEGAIKESVTKHTNNVDLEIKGAIQDAVHYAKIVTRTAAVPCAADASLITKATCGPLLAKAILKRFGFDYYNADITWRIVADCVWADKAANAAYFGPMFAYFGAIALFTPALPVVLLAGAALPALNVPRSARMFLMCAADLILILERSFWYHYNVGGGQDNVLTEEDVRSAAKWYEDRVQKVHDSIAQKLPLTSVITCLFKPAELEATLQSVIDENRYRPRRG